jgi:hypothetical protein
MRHIKMWRNRLRPLVSSLILFGLGVTTCLMVLQMSQNEIDGPAVYTNSQEYQSPQQLTQQEAPCEGGANLKIYTEDSIIGGGETFPENSGEYNRHSKRALKNELKSELTTVWVITPTFYRPEQKPELTRLAQALLQVREFVHWIIVEDISQGSNHTFKDLQQFMSRFSQITFTILKSFPPKKDTKIVGKPRGVGG